jgi:transcriptional antiterminator RfaH
VNAHEFASWYAIHTKPRQEERAAGNLSAWGVEVLAPRLVRKDKTQFLPFFPGYIFARFNINQTLRKIQFTRGIVSVVSFGGVPATIEDEIISEIQNHTDKNGMVHMKSNLKRGDAVMIQAGPLRNFSGVFEEELPGTARVRILLTTVAYTARIEVSKYDIAVIDGSPA